MLRTDTCSNCGAPLDLDAPEGFCPACMLQGALDWRAGCGQDAPSSAGKRFGEYELLEEIGRGGMGLVYRAHQLSLDRIVAVKLILSGAHASEASVSRFRAEAAAAAKLQHPHIVAIHEVGEEEGQPFFSMDYVAGRDLENYARDHPFTAREAAELVQTLAEATHYAHEQGIVHRDLKPSNILIDAAVRPHITDFGLAKRLDDSHPSRLNSQLTLSGQVLGSPSYLPPEQASAKYGAIGTHSDIYALGAILYFLLTGRPPFLAETISDTLHEVLNTEPVPPRLLNRRAPCDLETICLKCLEKEPARRYASARSLADELQRFLHDEPIYSRPIGRSARAWRWCRRRPTIAALSAALVVLLFAMTTGSFWATFRLEKARGAAVREWDRAERTISELKLQNAERLLEEGDSSSALALLARMLRDNPTNRVAASWIMDTLGRRAYPMPVTPAIPGAGTECHARFSPDGRRLATAGRAVQICNAHSGQFLCASEPLGFRFVEFGPDGTKVAGACAKSMVRILDAHTGKELTPPLWHGEPEESPVFSVRFSPDGSRVVTATPIGFARIWSAETGQPLGEKLQHQDKVNYAEFSPDGLKVLTASEDATAVIWDADNGAKRMVLRHRDEVSKARFSPDGTLVATASMDGTARLWDSRTGEPAWELQHLDFVLDVDFSPDGRWIATCSSDKTARVWDVRTGLPRTPPLRHTEAVNSVRFSPDSTMVLTASMDGTARIWSAETGQPLARPVWHARRIWYAEFSPDGGRILTASGDATVRVWEIRQPPTPVKVVQHNSIVFDAQFGPGGDWFVTATYNGKVRICDTRTHSILLDPMVHPKGVRKLELSADGQWLATVCRDGQLRVWSTRTGQLQVQLPRFAQGVTFAHFCSDSTQLLFGDHLARLWDAKANHQIGQPFVFRRPTDAFTVNAGKLSPDGRLAAVATYGKTVWLFDVRTHNVLGDPLQHEDNVRHLEFSPDSSFLLTASSRRARIWDLQTRRLHSAPLTHGVEIVKARFDREANRVVTASADGTARVWDAHTGVALTKPLKHGSKVDCACFSPDGLQVLTASGDGTARLWDALTGDPVTAPLVHGGRVTSARFSPDGRLVLTASRDGAARLWSPPIVPAVIPGWLADFAEAMAGKRVTETGTFEFVSPDNLNRIKKRLESLPSDDLCAAWAGRFF